MCILVYHPGITSFCTCMFCLIQLKKHTKLLFTDPLGSPLLSVNKIPETCTCVYHVVWSIWILASCIHVLDIKNRTYFQVHSVSCAWWRNKQLLQSTPYSPERIQLSFQARYNSTNIDRLIFQQYSSCLCNTGLVFHSLADAKTTLKKVIMYKQLAHKYNMASRILGAQQGDLPVCCIITRC